MPARSNRHPLIIGAIILATVLGLVISIAVNRDRDEPDRDQDQTVDRLDGAPESKGYHSATAKRLKEAVIPSLEFVSIPSWRCSAILHGEARKLGLTDINSVPPLPPVVFDDMSDDQRLDASTRPPISPPGPMPAGITFKATNISLLDAFEKVAELGNLTLRIEDSSVYFQTILPADQE